MKLQELEHDGGRGGGSPHPAYLGKEEPCSRRNGQSQGPEVGVSFCSRKGERPQEWVSGCKERGEGGGGQGFQKSKEELNHGIDVGVGKQGGSEPSPHPPPQKICRTGLGRADGRIRAP